MGPGPSRDLLASGTVQADVFRVASRSTNTLAAYRSDWTRFTRWCHTHAVTALPATPATVAAYLADAATETSTSGRSAPWRYAPGTIARFVATINAAHDLTGTPPPGADRQVADTLAGIRRLRASHYSDWPAASSRLWNVKGHLRLLFEFMIHGYLRPAR